MHVQSAISVQQLWRSEAAPDPMEDWSLPTLTSAGILVQQGPEQGTGYTATYACRGGGRGKCHTSVILQANGSLYSISIP